MRQPDVIQRDGASASRDRLEALLGEIDAAFAAGKDRTLERSGLEASDLARRLGDPRAECLAERAVGVGELRRGNGKRALARLERVLPIARDIGDPDLLVTLLSTLGTSAEMVGDAKRSDEARLEVESIARAIGDRARLGGSMADRGSFLGLRGEPLAGAELIRDGLEIMRPLGMTPSLRWSLLQLSILESRLGRVAAAWGHLGEALPAELDDEDPLMLTNIVGALFWLALAERRLTVAEGLWPTMLSALRRHGIYWQKAGFLEELAQLLVSRTGRGSVGQWLAVAGAPAERADLVAAIRDARAQPGSLRP